MIAPRRLRSRLVLVLALAFAPLFALLVYRAYHEQARRLVEIEASELRLARQIAATYGQVIERAHEVLRVLTQMPQIRALDATACTALVVEMVKENSQYANFSVARPDGQVICSGEAMTAPVNVADNATFRRALQSGGLVVGDYSVSRISGRPILGLGLAVRDATGATVAVAGALLNVDWLNRLAEENALPPGGLFSVVDSAGTLVVRRPDARLWVGKSLADNERFAASVRGDTRFEGSALDGVHRRFALATVQGIPPPGALYVSVGTDPDLTLGTMRADLYRDLAVLVAVALLAISVAWFGAERGVLRSLKALLAATRDLATGHLDARAGIGVGPSELRQLGSAFDEMATALQEREQEMSDSRKELAEQEALLRTVLEMLPVGVWIVAADGKVLIGNRQAREIWGGIKYVGIEGYGEYKAWRRDTGERIESGAWGVARALRSGETSNREVIDIEAFDGVRKTIAHWAAPIRDADSRITGAIGVNDDITEQKHAEQALIASEERFRGLFDNAPDAIIVAEPDGKFIDINPSGLRALGYTREEIIGLRPTDILTAVEAPSVAPALDKVRAGKPHRQEWTLKRKDGSTYHGEIFSCLMPNGNLLGIVRDITDRKRAEAARDTLEAQLRQAQKMEALGTLSGGIAHDFNNILGAIIGNVELARQDVAANHPAQMSLAEIRKASHRARDLVRQILIFSRQQPQERKVVQLCDVVEESVQLLRATLPAGVELRVEYAPDTPNVLADRTQIHQVLMNLCTNAWHAMEGHAGQIDISLDHVVVNGDAVRVDLPVGRYVRLTVRDNGKGMDAKTLERIFDPFFTTKGPSDGTGLGLAVVAGVMKSHDGAITVKSELGVGTTFQLYFLAADAQLEAPQEVPPSLPHGKRQRILYLDDEEPLVLLATRLLGRLGYEVTGCTRADEALATFRANPAAFDLLVTDLNMPSSSGLEVAREILRMRPDLPVALASGYVTDALRAQAHALGIREVIYKPNTVEDMAQAIHRLLSELG